LRALAVTLPLLGAFHFCSPFGKQVFSFVRFLSSGSFILEDPVLVSSCFFFFSRQLLSSSFPSVPAFSSTVLARRRLDPQNFQSQIAGITSAVIPSPQFLKVDPAFLTFKGVIVVALPYSPPAVRHRSSDGAHPVSPSPP